MMKMIYDLQSEEFNFLPCMHVYETSIPSFNNEAMYKKCYRSEISENTFDISIGVN